MHRRLIAPALGLALLLTAPPVFADAPATPGAKPAQAMIVKLANPSLRLFHEDGTSAPEGKLPALPTPVLDSAGGRYKVRGADGRVYIVRPLDVIVTGVCVGEPAAANMPTRAPGRVVAGVVAGAGKGC
ncbi:MAG: hypothetical protein BGN86_06665 [Caulobacterales bacterium 68-7]|nr:hypothetical protein [Caulobacterales bacterium]OJU12092.1 MAG: hypothetical protein BGN86_06665 [Caulobacterales bacterium 68-7]